MSHSTVCNMDVSTNTRTTLVKQIYNLRITLIACKGNAPVRMKEERITHHEVSVYFCKQSSVGVCMSPSIKSPVDSYFVYAMEALLEVLKEAHPERRVCVREIKRGHGCVYVCHLHSSVDNYLCMYVNPAEQLRLHKVNILLLIIKYFVL